ncbi:MAG: nucleotidyltransferase family protein [Pseudomonadota bacterium]
MRPSIVLDEANRRKMRDLTKRFQAENPRIFGSTLTGSDREGSDIDLLVDALPGATLFDLGGLQIELEELLGVPVDVVTPDDLPQRFRARVLAEARPL